MKGKDGEKDKFASTLEGESEGESEISVSFTIERVGERERVSVVSLNS